MKVAAIDLGTNSFLCLIAEVNKGRIDKVYTDLSRTVRLGEKVHETRKLQPNALARAEACLSEFSQAIKSVGGVDRIQAIATSAARDVSNREDLIEIGKSCGIPIKVISGDKEVELTYSGMIFDREEKQGLAGIDIGGGSTEIVYVEDGKVCGKSVDVGCVRLTEMFIKNDPPLSSEVSKMLAHAEQELRGFSHLPAKELIAVAGTPTSLACLELNERFDAKKIHGFRLSKVAIKKWLDTLSQKTVQEKAQMPGLDGLRADIIVAGAVLLYTALQVTGKNETTVSVCGARYGLALELENS